jgi:photosystem II stability/assembly factor-like uncharacterized protein/predicted esterase
LSLRVAGVFAMALAACGPPPLATGAFHSLALESGGEVRHYYLYVPQSAASGRPVPLVIDFHGTWQGREEDEGEESNALAELVAQSERHGFLVARPRSRSAVEDGVRTYRWDENPGDLERNARFARDLVDHLVRRYPVDRQRVYAFGFSTGTNMAAQMLDDFRGYGFVGGGAWSQGPVLSGAPPPRIYLATGYRDYLLADQRTLLERIAGRADLRIRTGAGTHALRGWEYGEFFEWVDQGRKPAPPPARALWWAEQVPGAADLNALMGDGMGGVFAVGSGGAIYHRSALGEWSEPRRVADARAWTGACLTPDGRGLIVGEGTAARTSDYGAHWEPEVPIRGLGPAYLDEPHYTAVACRADRFTVVGDWEAATRSADAPWTNASTLRERTPAQVAQVVAGDQGTWVAAGGGGYLARSDDGVAFEERSSPVDALGYLGVAAAPGGRWWAVGEGGVVVSSADDGKTWTLQQSGSNEDLYAVRFHDAERGVAVGTHGAALLTLDGGRHWRDVSPGGDAYLGDVFWLDARRVLAVGGGGRALVFDAGATSP